MSLGAATPLAAVPVPLLEEASSKLESNGPLLTLIGVLSFAVPDSPVAWPSTGTLSNRVGLTPRTIRRHILILKAVGVLTVHSRSPTRSRLLEVTMPAKIVPFGIVPVKILESMAELGALTICVYAVLAAYYNMKDGVAWPSQDTIASHLNVSSRSVRESLRRLYAVGLISKRGYTLSGTVAWRVEFGQVAIQKAVSILELHRSEVIGTGTLCPQPEATGTSPGSEECPKPDSVCLQVDQKETKKRMASSGLQDEAAKIAEDPGWFSQCGNLDRLQRAQKAVSDLNDQGYGPDLIEGLMALALNEGHSCFGSKAVEWISGGLNPELAKKAQALLELQEREFGSWPTDTYR